MKETKKQTELELSMNICRENKNSWFPDTVEFNVQSLKVHVTWSDGIGDANYLENFGLHLTIDIAFVPSNPLSLYNLKNTCFLIFLVLFKDC